MADGDKRNKMINEVCEIAKSMDRLAKQAEMEIRSESGLPQVKVQGYQKASKKNK